MMGWKTLGLGLGVVLVFVGALMATARAFDAAAERETLYRYLDDVLDPVADTEWTHDWEPPQRVLARPITKNDEVILGARIGEAWSAFGVAQKTGETAILADWFGGVALERAQHAAATAHADETRMAMLRQTLRPEFHHLDGSLVQLGSETLTVRYAPDHYDLAQDTFRTILLRRSTGWHVIGHERLASAPVDPPDAPVALEGKFVGVNYYPAQTPWSLFWPGYDATIIAEDLRLVVDLGGNAVRMFLPVDDFAPGSDLERNLANLGDFLRQAEALGLQVMPTLFDMKGNYDIATWDADLVKLDAVLPVLAASPAVTVIDIKNEPDLDFETHGKANVLAWLRTMAAEIRRGAPGIPLTVGWASAEAADLLVPHLEVVSYHDYAPLEGTADRLAAVRAAAGDKPVLVTEIGASAWSLTQDFPSSDAAQARDLATRLDGLTDADGVLLWTLHDFPDPDSRAVGSSLWVRGLQARYGIYDETGKPRPLAAILRTTFDKILNGEK